MLVHVTIVADIQREITMLVKESPLSTLQAVVSAQKSTAFSKPGLPCLTTQSLDILQTRINGGFAPFQQTIFFPRQICMASLRPTLICCKADSETA